jgi:hypothetical protein
MIGKFWARLTVFSFAKWGDDMLWHIKRLLEDSDVVSV